jgi:hypothetical protein
MKSLPANPDVRQPTAGEPIPPRPRPLSPSQAEAEATRIAVRCSGPIDGPGGSTYYRHYAFKCGAYESLYGEIYQRHLDALATIERMKPFYYPMFDNAADELPELPDAAFYDPDDADATELDLVVYQDGPSGPSSAGCLAS